MAIEQERQAHYHTLIAIHRANLQRLEEQEARHGMAVPLDIASGIAYEREAIQKLTMAMGSLMPASLVEELGPEGRFLVMTKMLEGQNAWQSGRDQAEREERLRRQQERDQREVTEREERIARQRRDDFIRYFILAVLVADIVLRFWT